MTLYHKLIVGYTVCINCFAYALMCYDKWQAKKKAQRIRERSLFFTAFLLGAPGIYFGMQTPLYHKAAKPEFKYGIPVLILVNLCIVYWLLML